MDRVDIKLVERRVQVDGREVLRPSRRPPRLLPVHKKIFRGGKGGVLCGVEGMAGFSARYVTCPECLAIMREYGPEATALRDPREIESSP